ncbi:MAG TPA: hypothetical protein VG388_09120 [Solirubrobacteraceae bacterium]|nr:hypothetical protein [Solirubrobacteraceae bacterium]
MAIGRAPSRTTISARSGTQLGALTAMVRRWPERKTRRVRARTS